MKKIFFKPYVLYAITLLVLGSILSPWIFSEELQGFHGIIIPPRMPLPPANLATAQVKEEIQKDLGVSHKSVVKDEMPAILEGWKVQIGKFSQLKQAIQLQNQLLNKGITASVSPFQSEYGVMVGPFLKKEQAQFMRSELQKKLQISGIIEHFDPASH